MELKYPLITMLLMVVFAAAFPIIIFFTFSLWRPSIVYIIFGTIPAVPVCGLFIYNLIAAGNGNGSFKKSLFYTGMGLDGYLIILFLFMMVFDVM